MSPDSRRYHRDPRPRFVRAQYSQSSSSSNPTMFDPFHGMPFNLAGGLFNQYAKPIGNFFGYGGGPNSPYGRGQGPLGQAMPGVESAVSGYLPSMTNLSSTLSNTANSTFGGYQNAIDQFMQKLPGFSASAGAATGGATDAMNYAKTAAADAFSPLQSRASEQEAQRRALVPAREGAAARGMLEGGQAQAGEQSLLSDLAFKTLESDKATQQQAISGLGGAASNLAGTTGQQAGIAGLGPQAMSALFSAIPQLGSLLTGAAQLPFQSAGQVMDFFQGMQNPMMSLLNVVKPQMGQVSSSKGSGGGL
jgi:hypothetical protein